MSYAIFPPGLTMLQALKTPSPGGGTASANQAFACEDLSAGMKRGPEGLHAEHPTAGLADLSGVDSDAALRSTHPAIRTHEETGRKALHVCRAFAERPVFRVQVAGNLS